jgi:hypothetical protein
MTNRLARSAIGQNRHSLAAGDGVKAISGAFNINNQVHQGC